MHRAQRSDTLAGALAEVLARPLTDPFAREVIAVPAKGVERWLNQRLATRLGARTADGIAANIDFPTPARLVDAVVSAAAGHDPDDDPWSATRTVWALLDTIDESLNEPWAAVLARHLGRDDTGTAAQRAGRRYATAAHLDRLFRSYATQRPQLAVDWASGRDTDGAGAHLADDLRWQAELWRRLRARIGAPSPGERLGAACARIVAEPELVDLPERIAVFGATRFTADQLEVFAALAAGRDVHLLLPHPSPAMWRALAERDVPPRRREDTAALAVHHPMLVSLGRDVRELQFRLRRFGGADVEHRPDPAPDTLLGHIQHVVGQDRGPSIDAAAERLSKDQTVQVYACHGPARQIEVLRESLLHLFQNDSTLEPRDVIVMCPDVETYAPLVRASFGQGLAGHPAHGLRVRLADRALHQTNDVLAVVETLLTVADGRITASQVLDLAAFAPVRRRFGFTDDDLERLREWAAEAGARWGLGEAQRAAFGLSGFPQNTFTTALDRILLGVAADETAGAWLSRALPLDDVDSTDIDLAGRFAEFVDRLDVTVRRLRGPQSCAAWLTALTQGLDLLTDVSAADTWQRTQADREIAAATEHAGTAELRLPDVRAMLATRLAGRPTRANFRTGELTVCTMVPMRSVPHRVVVLVGLDDEAYPRAGSVDGDDVLARDPLLGERDPRSEDRQLLLDAIMSATERLLLFYTGADPVTGAERPPAIPLSEVIDVVARTVGTERMGRIVRRHPLQPFDPRNFSAGAPFSFDRTALAGARASIQPPHPAPVFLPQPLRPAPAEDVDLDDLVNFAVDPTKAFLRQRLGVRIPEADEDMADALAADLDPLEQWSLGDRMLAARLTGIELDALRAAEWRRGTLPPFDLGNRVLEQISDAVEALVQVCLSVHFGEPETIDVEIDVGSGRLLSGTITGIHRNTIARTSYSRLGPKHRVAAWVLLLAAAASRPGEPWRAEVTGRGRSRQPALRSTLIPPDDPVAELVRLVDLRDRGLCEPLPLATKTSCVYAERRHKGDGVPDATKAAEDEWSGKYPEAGDKHLAYVHGGSIGFAEFASAAPKPDEAAWWPEPTRFGVLSRRLWAPLLAVEDIHRPSRGPLSAVPS